MIKSLLFSSISTSPSTGQGRETLSIHSNPDTEKASPFTRLDTHFISKGTRCAAWLYLPDNVPNPPVVIMAHGLGGERRFRLDAYAEQFAMRKMACFVFDYRCFGDSDGEPRHYINPFRHLTDWTRAIAHVKTLRNVDTGRIALWGTSFSAGHVIVMAAKTKGITAILGQVPFVDGVSSSMNYSILFSLRAGFHGFVDLILNIITLGKVRHRVQFAGTPETFAVLNTPDALPGIKKLIPEGLTFKCPASIFLTLPLYRPTLYAKKVTCPALIIYAENDSLIPASGVRKAISKMKNATGVCLPSYIGHFDPYVGKEFENTVTLQGDFLETCFGMNKSH